MIIGVPADTFALRSTTMRTPALLIALVLACSSFAQSTTDELIKAFFNTYSTGKVEKAVEEIYKTNP